MRDEIRLTIRPLPDARPNSPDQWQRLRMVLRQLLRRHHWKCVRIELVDGTDDGPDEGQNDDIGAENAA